MLKSHFLCVDLTLNLGKNLRVIKTARVVGNRTLMNVNNVRACTEKSNTVQVFQLISDEYFIVPWGGGWQHQKAIRRKVRARDIY